LNIELEENVPQERTEVEECSPQENQKTETNRFLGQGLALASAFSTPECSCHKVTGLPSFQLGCLAIWRDDCCHDPNFALRGLQAVVGANSILLVFFSLKYLNIGDSTVIGTSATVFVTFVACLFLGESCGFVSVLTSLLAVVGVGILSKPSILTGAKELSNDTIIGIAASVSSMLLLTVHFVTLRHLRTMHHALVNFCFVFWGLVESVLVAISMDVFHPSQDFKEIGLIIATAFLALSCITLALKYEQAGTVALVRTIEVVFAFVWQAVILGSQPDIFSVVGAFLVISGVVIMSLRNILMSLPQDHKYRSTFRFLLL
ncbi:hypothetical protein Ocin01_19692, partial [Orchesella cincta]